MTHQTGPDSALAPPRSERDRLIQGGIIIGLTVLTFTWALYNSGFSLATLTPLTIFAFDAYEFGVVFREIAIPLTLIYLFSSTNLFQRCVSGGATKQDMLKLFGVLLIIQALFLSYTLLMDEYATFGILVVIAGGLFGGWKMGLGLGIGTMLFTGTREFILYPEPDLLTAYQVHGLRGVFDLSLIWNAFFWYYLADLGASSVIWAGVVSGLCADLLGKRRFSPLPAMCLGMALSFGVLFFTALSWEDPDLLSSFLIPGSLAIGLAVAALALIVNSVQARIAQRKAEVAELAQTQAELRALRSQINPHFLFNALNTIRYFIRKDPEIARRLLLDLSAVFQHALRSGDFVPLRKELEYVEAYLALEQTRMQERLKMIWNCPGNDDKQGDGSLLYDQPVPTLILQPIVENAVVHGVGKLPEGGTIQITIWQTDDDLVLCVTDDGPGMTPFQLAEIFNPAETNNTSIGLRNINGRLQSLYGANYRPDIESKIGEGTRVQIRIPLQDKGISTCVPNANKLQERN